MSPTPPGSLGPVCASVAHAVGCLAGFQLPELGARRVFDLLREAHGARIPFAVGVARGLLARLTRTRKARP